ncbi:hypothetical protein [Tenacibaculum sp.]|uniref:hypothetical protein n=1 Tax=Tenacibaculum sp. TaxID=1906242 RepID=UPI003AA93504
MKKRIKIAIIAMMGMSLRVSAQNEVDRYFQVNADNQNDYVASRIFLKSHSDYRGAGIFSLGQTNNWFIGNPYTDHANSFMIGVTNISDGEEVSAQKKYAKFYLNKDGYVGVGTTNPDMKLSVRSNDQNIARFHYTGSSTISGFRIGRSNSYGDFINLSTGFGIGVGTSSGNLPLASQNIDDVDFFINNSTRNIGIGTTNPQAKLDVNGSLKVTSPGSTWIKGKIGTGGITYTTQLKVDKYHSLIRQKTYSGHYINLGGLRDYFGFFGYDKDRTENGFDHSMVMNLNTGNVGIGTLTTGSHKLAVEGSIGAREIKVEASGWSDFVFYEDYQLPTLTEVEKHIKEKGHLKDIPSAKEVEKNGFFLGAMDAKLLQKIEELTLYTIAQEKKIKLLEKQQTKLEEQEKKIEKLELLVEKLLKEKN